MYSEIKGEPYMGQFVRGFKVLTIRNEMKQKSEEQKKDEKKVHKRFSRRSGMKNKLKRE